MANGVFSQKTYWSSWTDMGCRLTKKPEGCSGFRSHPSRITYIAGSFTGATGAGPRSRAKAAKIALRSKPKQRIVLLSESTPALRRCSVGGRAKIATIIATRRRCNCHAAGLRGRQCDLHDRRELAPRAFGGDYKNEQFTPRKKWEGGGSSCCGRWDRRHASRSRPCGVGVQSLPRG